VALYEGAVGRNCQLLLNVPPDRRGLIAEVDVESMLGMRRLLDARYRDNLAREATGMSELTDGTLETFREGDTLTLAFARPIRFDRVVLQEPIAKGQRIARARLDAWVNGAWTTFGEITTVGYKRIVPVESVTTDQVRIAVLDSRAPPLIAEVGLYDTGNAR
jgi:alpha-L-fucosidase